MSKKENPHADWKWRICNTWGGSEKTDAKADETDSWKEFQKELMSNQALDLWQGENFNKAEADKFAEDHVEDRWSPDGWAWNREYTRLTRRSHDAMGPSRLAGSAHITEGQVMLTSPSGVVLGHVPIDVIMALYKSHLWNSRWSR